MEPFFLNVVAKFQSSTRRVRAIQKREMELLIMRFHPGQAEARRFPISLYKTS
jgi:hypothetical protein